MSQANIAGLPDFYEVGQSSPVKSVMRTSFIQLSAF